jgi:hypothetical protein
MVPATGFEPVRCYSLEPESSASANSATRATRTPPTSAINPATLSMLLRFLPWYCGGQGNATAIRAQTGEPTSIDRRSPSQRYSYQKVLDQRKPPIRHLWARHHSPGGETFHDALTGQPSIPFPDFLSSRFDGSAFFCRPREGNNGDEPSPPLRRGSWITAPTPSPHSKTPARRKSARC